MSWTQFKWGDLCVINKTSCVYHFQMSKAVVIPGSKDIGGMREELSISPSEKKDGAIGLLSRFLRFESLKRSSPVSPTSLEPSVTYYGVYIPCEIKKGPDEGIFFKFPGIMNRIWLIKQALFQTVVSWYYRFISDKVCRSNHVCLG